MDARKLLLAAVAVVAIALVAPSGASAKVRLALQAGHAREPVRAEPHDDGLLAGRQAARRAARRAGRSTRRADCFYVYPTVSRPAAAAGHPGRGRRAPLDRAPADRALLARLPGVRARLPPGHDPGPPQPEHASPRQMRSQGYADVRRGVAHLPAQVQPRPRRGPRQPLAGQLRAAEADRRGGGPEPGGPETHALGDPARRERHREEGQRPRRRLQEHPRLPLAAASSAA